MKASKVFTVLFGVAQLILFIKLLDLIQGSDASSHNTSSYSTTSSNAAASGAIFSHLGTHDRANSARAAVAFRSSSDTKEPVKSLDTRKSNNSSLTDVQNDGQDRSDSEGRGCPACTGQDCEASVTSLKYTVPIIPLKIVAIIGVLWLIFYFKVWKFPHHRPASQHSGYPASVGGYGGYSSAGYSSGGYGGYPSTDSGYSGGDGAGGVLDSVMRAIEKFSN